MDDHVDRNGAGLVSAVTVLIFLIAAFFAVTSISEFAVREQVLALLRVEKERASNQLLRQISGISPEQSTVRLLEGGADGLAKLDRRLEGTQESLGKAERRVAMRRARLRT